MCVVTGIVLVGYFSLFIAFLSNDDNCGYIYIKTLLLCLMTALAFFNISNILCNSATLVLFEGCDQNDSMVSHDLTNNCKSRTFRIRLLQQVTSEFYKFFLLAMVILGISLFIVALYEMVEANSLFKTINIVGIKNLYLYILLMAGSCGLPIIVTYILWVIISKLFYLPQENNFNDLERISLQTLCDERIKIGKIFDILSNISIGLGLVCYFLCIMMIILQRGLYLHDINERVLMIAIASLNLCLFFPWFINTLVLKSLYKNMWHKRCYRFLDHI